ncbi:hypothetical protein OSG_eHP14_00035 [environmental Halophage eHP-14]|nr:hypothetical protein OSG_eHP14_00035 [environmental Halophage eHP-14]
MSSEQSFSYNGPLSTFREWHSLGFGLAAGVLAGWSKTIRHEVRNEPHYFIIGLAVGAWVGTKLRGD